jgi:hypothetical protein
MLCCGNEFGCLDPALALKYQHTFGKSSRKGLKGPHGCFPACPRETASPSGALELSIQQSCVFFAPCDTNGTIDGTEQEEGRLRGSEGGARLFQRLPWLFQGVRPS